MALVEQGMVRVAGVGVPIQLFPPTPFSCPMLPTGAGAAMTIETQIGGLLLTPGWVSGVLVLRVHARGMNSGQYFRLIAQPATYCKDDPAVTFATSTGETICSVDNGGTTPFPLIAALVTPVSTALRFLMRATQNSTTSVMTATLSAEIVGRAG